MKQILIGLTFVFYLLSTAVTFADVVVITDKNKVPKFVLDTSTGKTTPVNGVYVEGGETPSPVPPIPPVDPPTNPQPPTGDTVRTFVKNLANQSDEKAVAKALSLIYGDCYSKLVAGEMTAADAQSWIEFTHTYAISSYGGDKTFWKSVVTKIDDQSTKLRQEGGLKTDAQWATFYKSVSAGLDDVAVGAAFDFEKFFVLLKKLFDLWMLIKTFGTFGGF